MNKFSQLKTLTGLAGVVGALVKHLPGQHDQMDHAHGTGKVSSTNWIPDLKEQGKRLDKMVEDLEESGEGGPGDQKYDALAHMATVVDQAVNTPASQKRDWRFEYGVDDDKQIVAAGSMKLDRSSKTAEIENLGSVQKGGGTVVVKTLMQRAKEAGMKKLELVSTARGFYEKLGFVLQSGPDSHSLMSIDL